jgi:hypothetical protein
MGTRLLKQNANLRNNRENDMFHLTPTPRIPSPAMVLTGTMDCLTTIIGIFFFGAVESNPLMAGFANTSLITFAIVKLSTTLVVAFLFHKANQALLAQKDKESRSFTFSKIALKGAYIVSTAFLVVAVLNNLIIVAQTF